MATNPLQRRRSGVDWMSAVLTIAFTAIGSWVFMLLVGVAHHEWIEALPTIGYSTAVLLFVLATVVHNCMTSLGPLTRD